MEVILSKDKYCEILKLFENFYKNLDSHEQALKTLEAKLTTNYGLPQRVAASIIQINFVRKMKFFHHRLTRLAPTLWNRYNIAVAEGDSVGTIMRLARENNSSPALLAKLILDQYHFEGRMQTSKSTPDNSDMNDTFCDRGKTKTSVPGEGKNIVSKQTRDTSHIEDGRLAKEILLAIYFDEQYGPISELYNRSIGEEYEKLLYKKAQEASLSFQSENDLRSKGYDKTPDLKLNVPIAVDGFVVNWIESKGLFGDEIGHRSYISEQYSSYWNRFGPGMVIYWLGYEDSIADLLEKRFIVRTSFPTNIVRMNPLCLVHGAEDSR